MAVTYGYGYVMPNVWWDSPVRIVVSKGWLFRKWWVVEGDYNSYTREHRVQYIAGPFKTEAAAKAALLMMEEARDAV